MCKKWIKAGLAAGIAGLVVSVAIQMLASPLTGPMFQSSAVWKSWSDPAMYVMYIVPFWVGLVMALVFTNLDSKSHMHKDGLVFGFKVWLLAGFPGMLMTFSSFAIASELVLLWMVAGLVQYLAMGWVIARMRP